MLHASLCSQGGNDGGVRNERLEGWPHTHGEAHTATLLAAGQMESGNLFC